MGLNRRTIAAAALVFSLSLIDPTQAQQDRTGCVRFPERQLTDITRRSDEAVVAWRASAKNSCDQKVDVEARFTLEDPDGVALGERSTQFTLDAGETIELQGDFVIRPLARSSRIGAISVVYRVR